MKTYVALLRGINVGGHNKLPMQELRTLLTAHGFVDVKTYIQSGNVLFKSLKSSTKAVEDKIQKLIVKQFKLEVPVLVLNKDTFISIFNAYPFSKNNTKPSFFTLLHTVPEAQAIAYVNTFSFKDEDFLLTSNCVYLHITHQQYHKAKSNNLFFEKQLGIKATTRNYRTMHKLVSLLQEM